MLGLKSGHTPLWVAHVMTQPRWSCEHEHWETSFKEVISRCCHCAQVVKVTVSLVTWQNYGAASPLSRPARCRKTAIHFSSWPTWKWFMLICNINSEVTWWVVVEVEGSISSKLWCFPFDEGFGFSVVLRFLWSAAAGQFRTWLPVGACFHVTFFPQLGPLWSS